MIGKTLSHYRIQEKLGSGGMGEVYRATDLKLSRNVAVKVLREELASDPERLKRFEQEARSASALNHPNIITIYDIGKHGETPYIAMEYVEGKTIRKILSEGALPTKELLQLSIQIAEGLAKAHSAGIIHRDPGPPERGCGAPGLSPLHLWVDRGAQGSDAVTPQRDQLHLLVLGRVPATRGRPLRLPRPASLRPVDARPLRLAAPRGEGGAA